MGVKTPALEDVAARLAITEVIHRYCRGMDRMDRELTLSCWHPGGTDEHAPLYSGSAEGFVDWLWPVHAEMLSTRHVVTNTIIALDGDKAETETYWSVTLRTPYQGKVYDIFGGGRYLDQFECRDAEWAIRHRQSILDWERVELCALSMADFLDPPLIVPNNPEVPSPVSRRDKQDISYQLRGLSDLILVK